MNHSTKSQEVKIYYVCRLQCRRTNLVPLLSISMASLNCHKGTNTEGEVTLIQAKWPPGIQLPGPPLTDGDTFVLEAGSFQPTWRAQVQLLVIRVLVCSPAWLRQLQQGESTCFYWTQNLMHFHCNVDTTAFLTFIAWRNQNDFKSWHCTFTC